MSTMDPILLMRAVNYGFDGYKPIAAAVVQEVEMVVHNSEGQWFHPRFHQVCKL